MSSRSALPTGRAAFRIASCVALSLLALSCIDSTEPLVPTALVLSTSAVSLDAVGATQTVKVVVLDQNEAEMTDVHVTWTPGSGVVGVESAAGDSAVVRAQANGSVDVAVAAGAATGSFSVIVSQLPVAVVKGGGDAQTGVVGAALAGRVEVVVQDRLGAPVAGQAVAFAAGVGSGALSPATVVSGADGKAAAVWTLGTNPNVGQEATASLGDLSPARFTATAVAGPPAALAVSAGGGQSARTGTAVADPPAVKVTDAFGNPLAGVRVSFALSGGGGSLLDGEPSTNVNGIATVGGWTLGPAAGANTLTATVPGTALAPVVFTATGTLDLPGYRVLSFRGANQAAMAGTSVPVAPAVRVTDPAGNPAAGIPVTFSAISGGGTVTGAVATSDADGVAAVGGWRLGALATLNTLTATVEATGITNNVVTFRAAGCSGGGEGYTITVCYRSLVSPAERAAFTRAADRWSAVITGDLPGVSGTISAGTCGSGSPTVTFPVDDLLIFASVEFIDGPGDILGSAGPCYLRATGFPYAGRMRFDTSDLAALQQQGALEDVILHEMGHVIGIGSLWSIFGLVVDPTSGSGLGEDTHYIGAGGRAGFDAIGGVTYSAGEKVPVENSGGPGTANSHWRDSVLDDELMTGYLGYGSNPLSLLTVRSLTDLGYAVNPGAADPFSLTLAIRAQKSGGSARFPLPNDVDTGPIYRKGPTGRPVRIR